MGKKVTEDTRKIAEKYFHNVTDERPYDLWRSFDKEMARDLSLFVTGQVYAREKIPHTTRQLVTVAALSVLGRLEELKLHIQAALNVGCAPQEIAEVIGQMSVFGGVPAMTKAMQIAQGVIAEQEEG